MKKERKQKEEAATHFYCHGSRRESLNYAYLNMFLSLAPDPSPVWYGKGS